MRRHKRCVIGESTGFVDLISVNILFFFYHVFKKILIKIFYMGRNNDDRKC